MEERGLWHFVHRLIIRKHLFSRHMSISFFFPLLLTIEILCRPSFISFATAIKRCARKNKKLMSTVIFKPRVIPWSVIDTCWLLFLRFDFNKISIVLDDCQIRLMVFPSKWMLGLKFESGKIEILDDAKVRLIVCDLGLYRKKVFLYFNYIEKQKSENIWYYFTSERISFLRTYISDICEKFRIKKMLIDCFCIQIQINMRNVRGKIKSFYIKFNSLMDHLMMNHTIFIKKTNLILISWKVIMNLSSTLDSLRSVSTTWISRKKITQLIICILAVVLMHTVFYCSWHHSVSSSILAMNSITRVNLSYSFSFSISHFCHRKCEHLPLMFPS